MSLVFLVFIETIKKYLSFIGEVNLEFMTNIVTLYGFRIHFYLYTSSSTLHQRQGYGYGV